MHALASSSCLPAASVVSKWLDLIEQVFRPSTGGKSGASTPVVVPDLDMSGVSKPAVGIHCAAGLGRAPVMVAIALVEHGMEPFDAIAFVRKKRRGAINARQLKYIEEYKRRQQPKGECCSVQ